MNKRKISATFVILIIFLGLIVAPFALADDSQCNLGEVYVNGAGCQVPDIKVTKTVKTMEGVVISSAVGGTLEAIRIDNPFAAPGQPVLVELTLSNVGTQYPFNLIPLPPNQYAFVMTLDPVDKVLYKKEDGTYDRYDMNKIKWGSWFGSDWFAKGVYLLKKSLRDFKEVTSEDLCKYVEVGDLFPDFAKQRFVYDNYENEMEDRHGRISEKNFIDKIDDEDLEDFFPAVYEWECIRSVDRESFETEIQDEYCGSTITMGCMGEYMQDNIGKLKTSSFVILTDEVGEGTCEYDQGDGVTYCGVGQDGICPEGSESYCDGDSSYTYEFVMLVPADAPALSPQEFDILVNSGDILGDFKTNSATGEQYNFGFTQSATCPDDDYSGACHTLNVRVQAVNKSCNYHYQHTNNHCTLF